LKKLTIFAGKLAGESLSEESCSIALSKRCFAAACRSTWKYATPR
jgi:hypothetical protein